MLDKGMIDKFYEDVRKLRLKFPVAAITEATGFNKGTVSEYLNKKQDPSANFLKAFYKSFGDSLRKVPRETGLDTLTDDLREWQAGVEATLAVLQAELIPLISKDRDRSIASVFEQLKKDIEEGTRNRIASLKKK